MGKKQKQQASGKMRRNRMIIIGAVAAIAAIAGLFGYYSSIPANGSSPVFGAANHFIKASYDAKSGYVYVSQSSGAVKGLRTSSASVVNPTYSFSKGDPQSIHVINEDYDTHSKHNFNIDAFNVHTRDLGYFESQTVTFVTDKVGTFPYYCTIHPEMKGNIEIQ